MIRERLDVSIDIIHKERLYCFNIPYGVPFENVDEVMELIKKHLEEMKIRSIEQQKQKEEEIHSNPPVEENSNG